MKICQTNRIFQLTERSFDSPPHMIKFFDLFKWKFVSIQVAGYTFINSIFRAPLLKNFFFANQLPATPYRPSLCLLSTGAWHAPVIRSSSRILTNESPHAFHTYPSTLVLPFPVLPRLVLF